MTNQDTPVDPQTDITDAQALADQEAQAGETTAATEADPMAALEAEVLRWKDLALRSQADFDNFRKRTARDITEIRRYAAGDLLADLLPVLDNFDLGLMAARNESENSAIALGMQMVRRQLDDFLTTQGVKEIAADGEAFDPTKHDAVATEAHESIAEGIIIRTARKGYFLHERVLRAPSVIVSSGPAAPESAE